MRAQQCNASTFTGNSDSSPFYYDPACKIQHFQCVNITYLEASDSSQQYQWESNDTEFEVTEIIDKTTAKVGLDKYKMKTYYESI